MRLWKILFVVAVVSAGFGTGYIWKHRHPAPQPPASSPPPAVVANEPQPVGFDQNLVLPPPSDKGVTIDPPIDLIRDHFRDQAGLKPPTLPPGLENLDMPPVLLPASAQRQPVVRLPAPDEEPKALPVARRVIQRQAGMWLYTNSRDVRLNFDVTKSGPSGIKAVELWGRRNSEMPYDCVDRMESDQPPFSARLWSEGNYELRLVCVSRTGVKSALPTRDDPPDIYVCLDTTPPSVEMFSPLADAAQAGVVMLRWTAQDRNLDDNPIRLEYSSDAETWQPVTGTDEWLPNSGQYAWKVPAGLPNELHLRVRARDKAGNIGESRGPNKFPVDLTVPEGRISGFVEPLPEPRAVNRSRFDIFDFDLPPLKADKFHEAPTYPEEQSHERLPMPREVIFRFGWEELERSTGVREFEEQETELLPMPAELSKTNSTDDDSWLRQRIPPRKRLPLHMDERRLPFLSQAYEELLDDIASPKPSIYLPGARPHFDYVPDVFPPGWLPDQVYLDDFAWPLRVLATTPTPSAAGSHSASSQSSISRPSLVRGES